MGTGYGRKWPAPFQVVESSIEHTRLLELESTHPPEQRRRQTQMHLSREIMFSVKAIHVNQVALRLTRKRMTGIAQENDFLPPGQFFKSGPCECCKFPPLAFLDVAQQLPDPRIIVLDTRDSAQCPPHAPTPDGHDILRNGPQLARLWPGSPS